LPEHGRIQCTLCFDKKPITWGVSYFENNGWRLENNPGAWGSSDPLVLVLGVSKGTNQCNKINSVPHNEIPFKGERAALSKILNKLGLLPKDQPVDVRISSTESDFAFGSLIRCSIAMHDSKNEKWLKAGPVVKASATNPQAKRFVRTCAQAFLSNLSTRTKLIVMLSNDDDYIASCFSLVREIYPHIEKKNDVSYGNSQHTWVHVIHPSGSSGRHIPHWLENSTGKQAQKRTFALAAVKASGALTELYV